MFLKNKKILVIKENLINFLNNFFIKTLFFIFIFDNDVDLSYKHYKKINEFKIRSHGKTQYIHLIYISFFSLSQVNTRSHVFNYFVFVDFFTN